MIRRTVEVKYKQIKDNLRKTIRIIDIFRELKDYGSNNFKFLELKHDAENNRFTLVEMFEEYSSLPIKNKKELKRALNSCLSNVKVTKVKITEKEEE